MTVSSEVNKSGPYNGNGVTTVFDYDFRIVSEDHITVIKRDATDVEAILVIDADYIVSDVGNPLGGQVAMLVAPSTGETITILRNVPFTQETDLENQGAYYAETVEAAFDLAAMRDQQLSEGLARAVQIPASADPSELDSLIEDIVRLGDSADAIDTVATNIGAVNITADNIAAIIDAPNQAAAAALSAGAAADSAGAAAQSETNAVTAAQAAQDAVSSASSSIFPTKAVAEAYAPAVAPDFINTAFYDADQVPGSGAKYKKNGTTTGDLVITLSDGVTDVGYDIAASRPAIASYGAVDTVDDKATWDAAIAAAVNDRGITLPEGVNLNVNNGVGIGADIVARRADAVANGGLRALTCDLDNFVIEINGTITGKSPLDDVIRCGGKNVTVSGRGLVRNISGEFLDTNAALFPPETRPLNQWYPSLVCLSGDGSGVIGTHGRLRLLDAPTVGAFVQGERGFGKFLEFQGGLTSHGSGTMSFGIYAGMPSVSRKGHVYEDIIARPSDSGGVPYTAIFGTATDSVFDKIFGYDVLEHVIYLYGRGSKVVNSHGERTGHAAFQIFATDMLVQGNTAIDSATGFNGMAMSGAQILDNEFLNMGVAAVSMRTLTGAPDTNIDRNVTIRGNRLSLAADGAQSPIDVQTSGAFYDLAITDNVVSGGKLPGSQGQAGIRVYSTSAAVSSRLLTISGNRHSGHAGYSHSIAGHATQKIREVKISDEVLTDVAGAGTPPRAIQFTNIEDGSVSNNSASGSATLGQILFATNGNGNARIIAENNRGFGLAHSADPLVAVPSDGGKSGNTRNGKPNYVDFTMDNAASKIVTGLSIDWGAKVQIIPMNANAETLQRGANAIRWSATSTGQFTVVTISGAASATGSAEFRAKWEQ